MKIKAQETTMPDDETTTLTAPTLFEEANGDALEGFLLAKARDVYIPRSWIGRTHEARRNRHEAVVATLSAGDWSGIETLRDWNDAYRRECFYYGVHVLLELDRKGECDL